MEIGKRRNCHRDSEYILKTVSGKCRREALIWGTRVFSWVCTFRYWNNSVITKYPLLLRDDTPDKATAVLRRRKATTHVSKLRSTVVPIQELADGAEWRF